MGLFQDWLVSGYVMKLFIIHLVSCLSFLCNVALAQFDISEGLTGSTSFPEVAITALGNLAVFLTCLVRGRLDAEMGTRDLLECITGPKLHDIRGFGLTTCRYKWEENAMGGKWSLNLRAAKVVMLSKDKPSCSMWQFMKYTSHVYDAPSIQLQLRPFICSGQVDGGILPCCQPRHECHCIAFNTVEEITMMLAERMPGTLKLLSDSECLLPCLSCLTNGCHQCNEGLLHVEEVEAGRTIVEEEEPGRENVDEEEPGRENVEEEEPGRENVEEEEPGREEPGRENVEEEEPGRENVEEEEPGREEPGRENVDEEEPGRKIRKKILTDGCRNDWPVAAVCEILDDRDFEQSNSCICIPTHPAEYDKWTEMLITSLKTKDKDARGVINLASDALQHYITQCGVCNDAEEYDTLSLIVPRFAEALVNIILTAWLRVDGFSSALIARRAIRHYIVDSRGSGIAGNAFLSKSRVYANLENTHVCQVLTFRGSLLSFGTFSIIITCVNLLCSITWAVLIALEGGTGKWYEPEAMPLSKPRVYVIMITIVVRFGLGFLDFFLVLFRVRRRPRRKDNGTEHGFGWLLKNELICPIWKNGLTCLFMVYWAGVCVIHAFEIWCFVFLARGHLRVHGTWFYGALQALVWMRWGISILVYKYEYEYEYGRGMIRILHNMNSLRYASTFLLNAIFVGVRGKWKYLPS